MHFNLLWAGIPSTEAAQPQPLWKHQKHWDKALSRKRRIKRLAENNSLQAGQDISTFARGGFVQIFNKGVTFLY